MNFFDRLAWLIGVFTIACAIVGAITPGTNFIFCFGKTETCTLVKTK